MVKIWGSEMQRGLFGIHSCGWLLQLPIAYYYALLLSQRVFNIIIRERGARNSNFVVMSEESEMQHKIALNCGAVERVGKLLAGLY